VPLKTPGSTKQATGIGAGNANLPESELWAGTDREGGAKTMARRARLNSQRHRESLCMDEKRHVHIERRRRGTKEKHMNLSKKKKKKKKKNCVMQGIAICAATVETDSGSGCLRQMQNNYN
jgi:hypothetical protein